MISGKAIALTEIVRVTVLGPVLFEAVTVYVLDAEAAVGVPEITPVLVLNDNPVGRAGEILHEVAGPPEFVGVKDVIATLVNASSVLSG